MWRRAIADHIVDFSLAAMESIAQKSLAVSEALACDSADEERALSCSQIDTYALTKSPREWPAAAHNIQENRL